MSFIDEIIEIYKRGVDQTLVEECLRRTVEERILAIEEFKRFRGSKPTFANEVRSSIKSRQPGADNHAGQPPAK